MGTTRGVFGLTLPMVTVLFVGYPGILCPTERKDILEEQALMVLGTHPMLLGSVPFFVGWWCLQQMIQSGPPDRPGSPGLRAGLALGCATGLWYSLVVAVGYGAIPWLAVLVVLAALGACLWHAARSEDRGRVHWWGEEAATPHWVVVLLAVAIGLMALPGTLLFLPILLPISPLTFALSCAWTLVTSARRRVPDEPVVELSALAVLGGGGLAFHGAAVRLALDRYADLPPHEPGGCYVATAAARGHPWVVGARPRSKGPGPGAVTPQLRTLKAAEIALMVTVPGWHRRLRRGYDALGPPLAARLDRPWKADLAWALLQPATLVARAWLRTCVPGAGGLESRLYR